MDAGSQPTSKTLSGAALRRQRLLVLVVVGLPFLGTLAALWLLWGVGVGPLDLAILVAMYLFTGFGITVGYHRLFTHRSFEVSRGLRGLFAIAGSMALQGPLLNWVADHRRHHAFSDEPGDPHSPQNLRDGVATLRGLWHAHTGWLFDAQKTRVRRFVPDLVADIALQRIDRLYVLWMVASLGIPAALGFALTGSARGAATALLWGGLVRIFLVQHVTWSVNSICHTWGRRPFATGDRSANNAIVAVLSLGEGWHNNHHAFPTSARHGLGWRQIDPSWLLIAALERLGVASRVKRAPAPTS